MNEHVRLVAVMGMRQAFRSKAYRVSLVVVLLIVVAAIVVPKVVGDRKTTWRIGLAGDSPPGLATALRGAAPAGDTTIRVRTVADAKRAVRDGDVTIAVVGGDRIVADEEVDPTLRLVVSSVVHQLRLADALARAGVAPAERASLLRAAPLPVTRIDAGADDEARKANEGLAFAGVILLYLALISSGNAVAAAVIEEKSSRVIEVLLATARPVDLLAGKVIGIGAMTLLQVVLTALTALGAGLAVGSFSLPHGTFWTGASLVVWFVLGYLLYATLFAGAGSLVSRQEDASAATTPMNIVMLGGYLLALSSGTGSPVMRVLSWLPPLSPMMIPVRAARGDAAAWEVVATLALTAAATVAAMRFSAFLYARGVLQSGPRLGWREALRSEAG